MGSDDIRSAERELLATLKTGQTSRQVRWKRWTIRSMGSVVALGLGGWIAVMMWPHWIDYRDRQPPKPDAPSLTQAPAVPAPAPAPDVTTSVLGTSSSASESAQQLVLVATSLGRNASESTAMLGTDPRNPQTYAQGSTLANGAVIAEIHADRIVLLLNGRRSTLALDRSAASRIAMRDTLSQSDKTSPTVLESLATPTGADPATIVGGPNAVRRPLDRSSSSRDDFSEIMRSQPVFERDKFAGLRIFAGNRPAALQALGLKEGDIVRTVEGKPVDGDGAWQAIDDAVTTGASIVVGIERDGALMSVSLDGAQLAESQSGMPPPPNG
jgi:type II secretory pathway component PulC